MLQVTLHRPKAKCTFLLLLGMVLLSRANVSAATSAVQQAAPDFSRKDLEHHHVRLASYRGKAVLLNFWATWCTPCLTEIPRLRDWQELYGGAGLQIIGVSMDDEEAPVRALYQKYRLNYPVVMGDERLGELYGGILGLPVTFLIDRRGKIRYKHEGQTNLEQLQHEIQTLLAEHGQGSH